MRKFLLVFVLGLLAMPARAQDRQIDRLEIFYDQGYYRKVIRMTKRMEANPKYDYSGLPGFYQSMSLFRLADDDYWRKRNQSAIDNAIAKYRNFLDHPNSPDYVNQHYYEIASIKVHITKMRDRLKKKGLNGTVAKLDDFLKKELGSIDESPLVIVNRPEEDPADLDPPMQMTNRDKMVVFAKQYLGVQYKSAGMDQNGFDCSGFTAYIFREFGILLPRTANGQQDKAKEIKVEKAQKGDLVFFGPGVKVTHVGMVISEKGQELEMIHASSSKGVIITNVMQSSYWKPKLKGVGTYL